MTDKTLRILLADLIDILFIFDNFAIIKRYIDWKFLCDLDDLWIVNSMFFLLSGLIGLIIFQGQTLGMYIGKIRFTKGERPASWNRLVVRIAINSIALAVIVDHGPMLFDALGVYVLYVPLVIKGSGGIYHSMANLLLSIEIEKVGV
ncbi:MAG: hypothetical protein WC326_14705 [Candidatus Delongbacteria bacterium]